MLYRTLNQFSECANPTLVYRPTGSDIFKDSSKIPFIRYDKSPPARVSAASTAESRGLYPDLDPVNTVSSSGSSSEVPLPPNKLQQRRRIICRLEDPSSENIEEGVIVDDMVQRAYFGIPDKALAEAALP